jgi:single-strand DNA-binding protein
MSEEKYTMTGTVKRVEDLQEFAGGFSKREFILTTGDKYPQDIKFTCTKDKTALIDGVSEGDELTVHFNIYGSHWEAKDKYFVDLNAWKIDKTALRHLHAIWPAIRHRKRAENLCLFNLTAGQPGQPGWPRAADEQPNGETFPF